MPDPELTYQAFKNKEEFDRLTEKIERYFGSQAFCLLLKHPRSNLKEAKKLWDIIERCEEIREWAKETNKKEKFEAKWKEYKERFQID
jgi:uncharacterized protein YcgL (UPF0745 family)